MFLGQSGLYRSVIAGVPPTACTYNVPARNTTQITLDRGSGARHYGIPDAHCAQAPDYPSNGSGLVPFRLWDAKRKGSNQHNIQECTTIRKAVKHVYTESVGKHARKEK